MPIDIGVIIVAAGQSSRFGGELPKQYVNLDGVPILLRSLRPFMSHPEVDSVTLVLPPDDVLNPPEWLQPHLTGRLRVVAGGSTRTASVRNGLASLRPESQFVLVHDGARPLVGSELISRVIGALRTGISTVPAVPVTDTVKRANEQGRIASTVDRNGLWLVQTPQGFPRNVLERAYLGASESVVATDDAAMVEALGEPLQIVPGAAENIKITTAHDLALAEWFLSR